MKITVSVKGRFHAFHLACQLEKAGFLERLITTYPKFAAEKYGIPKSKTKSFWPLEIFSRLWPGEKIGLHEVFDRLASHFIPRETEIFVGWSSFCLESLRQAKKQGALAVVDEGSSHVLFQTEILREEYGRCGLKPRLSHPRIVERELKEYEQADRIVIPSSFVKRSFLRHGVPEKKLLQAAYGADPARFYPAPKEDDVFRVIHCGALSLRKGVHYLLQAFYELNLPGAELWLIGSLTPEMLPFLKKYHREGKVFHKGPYPEFELYRHYSQGSVFCLASLEDGFGMVIPQAMMCGLPVIATTNTGAEDAFENGAQGYVIPIRDVEALKEKLFLLYENPDSRRRMGEAARSRALEALTWDAYGRRMIDLYRGLLSKSPLSKGDEAVMKKTTGTAFS